MNKYVKAYHFFTKNINKIDTQSRADAYIRVVDPYLFFTDPDQDPDPVDPDGGRYGSGYGSGSGSTTLAYIRKKSKKPKNPKYQKTQKNNWAGFF